MLACPPITHGMPGFILEMIGVSLSSVISRYAVTNAPEVEKSKKFPEVTVHSRACRTVAPSSHQNSSSNSDGRPSPAGTCNKNLRDYIWLRKVSDDCTVARCDTT